MESNIKEIFFRNKPVSCLLAVEKGIDGTSSFTSVQRETGYAYSHITKLFNHFEDLDIVEMRDSGRTKIISLTKRGKKLAEDFRRLFEDIDRSQKYYDRKKIRMMG